MQCIASQNGRHSFTRSYVEEEDIFIANNENTYAVLFNKKEQILSGGLLLLVCIVSGEVSALFDQIKLSYKFIQHGSLGGELLAGC